MTRALAFAGTGRDLDAAQMCAEIIRGEPGHVGAMTVLAALALRCGYVGDGGHWLRAALAALGGMPAPADASNQPAIRSHRSHVRLLAIDPGLADAWNDLGTLLKRGGRIVDARACLYRTVKLRPDHGAAWSNLGNLMVRARDWSKVEAAHRRATTIEPGRAPFWRNRGSTLNPWSRAADIVLAQSRSIMIEPGDAVAWRQLGLASLLTHRHWRGLACFRRAVVLDPGRADNWDGMAKALNQLGNLLGVSACLDRALLLEPGNHWVHSNKIFTADFVPGHGFAAHQRIRREWAAVHGRPVGKPAAAHPNDRDPERRLAIGYVSADFKLHSAASCFLPVLRQRDTATFKTVCYSGVVYEDSLTGTFRNLADIWVDTCNLDDAALEARIRADGIDILVDLSGHTDGNRLLVFARKPAPIQVTAWGYPSGTGLKTIDYLFSDRVGIPANVHHLFAEKVWNLPCQITFDEPRNAPPVQTLPAESHGFVTFGCLNRFSKISDQNLRQWSEILRSVPGARLLLKDKSLSTPAAGERALLSLQEAGIPRNRVALRGESSRYEHLLAYGDVDIALDPYPLGGGVSTYEALLMGVPVVAKLGDTQAGRVAGAIISAVGLADWVAGDDDDYVAIAIEKARDIARLGVLRRSLRARVATSEAGNPERYTRTVEAAYRAMSRQWCRQNI
jgi:tetratricopeptide (TPR) repeat protein